MKERRCHVCRCTETRACPGRCWWIGQDLCSSCGIRASRHLRERPLLRQPRKFFWKRHVDIEMGFVSWSLRYCINGRMYGSDLTLTIEDLQMHGRAGAAQQLRMIRFHHRICRAGLRAVVQEKKYG